MSINEHAWDDVEGLAVFTSDDEQVGTVEHVLPQQDDPAGHFLVVHADDVAAVLGTDRLFVPDSDVLTIEEDRIVLDATVDTLARPDWTTPPAGWEELVG